MDKYIFVSHSSKDSGKVRRVVDLLESSGVKCWVSYRDIPPGADWAETIYDAIAGSSGMVFLFSSSVNKSRQIRNELDIATNLDKPIIPLKLSDVPPSKGIRYFTNSHQWLDATHNWAEASRRLIDSINQTMNTELDPVAGGPIIRKKKNRLLTFLGILLAAAISAYAILRIVGGGSSSEDVSGLLNLVAGGQLLMGLRDRCPSIVKWQRYGNGYLGLGFLERMVDNSIRQHRDYSVVMVGFAFRRRQADASACSRRRRYLRCRGLLGF